MHTTPAQETPLGIPATRFLHYLRDVRQLSPHTISNYQRDLISLERYCKASGKGAIEALVEADIRAWASQLRRQGLAGSSIQLTYYARTIASEADHGGGFTVTITDE